MRLQHTRSAGQGLERSCARPTSWIASRGPVGGVEALRAWLVGEAYARHRHETYAVGVTDAGVQLFHYRGATRASRPGQVVVLHPDEVHDGRGGTREGFGYRIVYVEPGLLAEALRTVRGRPGPLPFVPEAVCASPRLARAVDEAFAAPLEALAVDALVTAVAEGLVAADGGAAAPTRRIDTLAVERARAFLEAEHTRSVRSAELERVTGLTRYELARQFRSQLGTSPYRYLLQRRLDAARVRVHRGRALADVAAETGFADQAHFTRAFRAAVGLTPGRYRVLAGAYTTSSVRAVVSPKRPRAKGGRPA
jgi:AraC-like DNA-binding protein